MFPFLLIVLFTTCLSEKICEEKYREITPKHSMCLEKNESCKIYGSYNILKENFLQYHNALRNEFKNKVDRRLPLATNMLIMEWDEELLEMAKKYASQCNGEPECEFCHQTEEYDVSQNFAVKTFTEKQLNATKGPTQRFKDVIYEWAKEITDYEITELMIQNFQPQSDKNNSNWINILNANTNKVGCAGIVYEYKEDVYHEIYICNYRPANLTENEIYKTGDRSCSECPNDYVCDTKYTNLCNKPIETTSTSTSTESSTKKTSTISPTEKPIALTEKPIAPTEKPIAPTEKPIAPTEKPIAPTEKPIETTSTSTSTESSTKKTSTIAPTEKPIETTSTSTSTESSTSETSTNTQKLNYVTKNGNEFNHIGIILWKCEFDIPDSEDCLAEQQCYKDWNIIASQSRNFQQIRLPPFEITSLLFLKTIHIEDESCFTFRYKIRFTNIKAMITVVGVAVLLSDINVMEIGRNEDKSSYENKLAIDIPWTNEDIKVGIIIRSDSPIGQVIDINEPTVFKGKCLEIK